MKSYKNTLPLLLLVFLFITPMANAQTTYFKDIDKEYPINLKKFNFPQQTGNSEFENRVKSDPKGDANYKDVLKSIEEISIKDMDSLYRIAKANLPASTTTYSGVTGVLFHYGLTKDSRMQIFFSPWVMDINTKRSRRKRLVGSVSEVLPKYVYYYNDQNEFTRVLRTDSLVDSAIYRYKNHIRIEYIKGSYRNCDFTLQDWQADTEKAFMNFQQIKNLFKEVTGADSTKYLYIYEKLLHKNYQIHGTRARGNKPKKYKIASYLLTEQQLKFLQNLKSDYDNYFNEDGSVKNKKVKKKLRSAFEGNLTGLCPPGCNDFQYPLM